MTRTRTKILTAGLAAVLPLVAVAGCGVEKRRSIKAELTSAGNNLEASKVMSVTFRLKDNDDNLLKATIADDTPKELAPAFIGGSMTYTVDPAGNQTLADLQADGLSEPELKDAIKEVNLAFVVRSDKAAIAELRLVDGTLFAHVDLKEIDRLAVLGGEESIDADLDEMAAEDPDLEQVVDDVRAGKWLKLPLADYIDSFTDLAESLGGYTQPEPDPAAKAEYKALGDRLFNAVKPHVTVTDANDDSSKRVLDVKVNARPALKAALAVLKASKDLPFAEALGDVAPTDIDENVKDGTVNGTITLESGHFSQFTLDIESVRALDPEATGPTLKGGHVVFEVDDDADEVTAPLNVSSFDIGEMLDGFLSELEGEQAA